MKNQKTKTLVECALMVALSVILNYVKFAPWPNGGSVTAASMAPIIFVALRHGPKWGLLSGFVLSILQMLLDGISPPPTESFFWFAIVVLLDYVLAYTVLGLAPVFAKLCKNGSCRFAPAVGALSVTLLRYCFHIVSGIAIWGVYAWEWFMPSMKGQPIWLYSVLYNGSYMIPEIIITTVVVTLLVKTLGKKLPA